MSEGTKIQWCDDTHNFWRGCKKVSPGCAHCYAEVSTPVRVARSEGRELWGGTLRDRAKDFDAPLRWNEKPWVCDECGEAFSGEVLKPHVEFHTKKNASGTVVRCDCKTFHRRRIFSLSLGDIWDETVPIQTLADALDVIRRCPNLDFLLLTKRPENFFARVESVLKRIEAHDDWGVGMDSEAWPRYDLRNWLADWVVLCAEPPNVWLGATVENQEYADKRIPELLKIPAVCRFLSVEPMLGPIEFSNVSGRSDAVEQLGKPTLAGIDWIIVGGESGPKARPFNIEWARSTVAQCKAAGVACFVKQMGAKPYDVDHPQKVHMKFGKVGGIHIYDKKGGDMSEWPLDLRVREFPNPHLTHER